MFQKLIAIKNIINDPDKLGLKLPARSSEPQFVVVDFEFQIDLNRVATGTDTQIEDISRLNPGLRRGNYTTNRSAQDISTDR